MRTFYGAVLTGFLFILMLSCAKSEGDQRKLNAEYMKSLVGEWKAVASKSGDAKEKPFNGYYEIAFTNGGGFTRSKTGVVSTSTYSVYGTTLLINYSKKKKTYSIRLLTAKKLILAMEKDGVTTHMIFVRK